MLCVFVYRLICYCIKQDLLLFLAKQCMEFELWSSFNFTMQILTTTLLTIRHCAATNERSSENTRTAFQM
jgi:hypothetical protein